MNSILKNIFKVIGFILGFIILQSILNFFGFKVSTYLIYLLWIVALLIFYLALPGDYDLLN
tara:strand:+ start:5273 stop:5455 length:183 start_codon:yes stop_codon:yes gene_type:complete